VSVTPVSLLAVAGGGALGASLRYLVAVLSRQGAPGAFPTGTLSVNLLGCLLIGVAANLFAAGEGTRTTLRLFLVVGLLGGFTTFSSFGLETLRLLEEGRVLAAALYVAASNVGGLGLCYLGMRAAAP